jgi:zinc D-Ala-D-Ala carboxypeptidase
MDFKQYLSNNFTLWECIRSETAARLNIDNTPPEIYIPKLTFLCNEILEPVRNYFGVPFSPNSVYRCPELNKAVKGQKTSQHPEAEAVDFEIPGTSNYDLAVWCKIHFKSFDQLILECYQIGIPDSGWVHLSMKMNKSENRNEVLTFSKNQYVAGLIK